MSINTSIDDNNKIFEYMNTSLNNVYNFTGSGYSPGKYNISPFKDGKEIPKYFMKNLSCTNGIKEIHFMPAIYCKGNDIVGVAINQTICNKNNKIGPTGPIKSTDEININCGNHPITYFTQNEINGRQQINYACGLNETNSDESTILLNLEQGSANELSSNNTKIIYDYCKITDNNGNITKDISGFHNKHFSNYINIACPNNKVLTGINVKDDLNNKVIIGTCKSPTNFIEKSQQEKSFLFTDNKSTDVTGFNVQVDNYESPNYFWGSPTYGNSTTSYANYIADGEWDKLGFSMTCRDRGISGIEQSGSNIKYTCGSLINPYHISEHSYISANVNSNKDSYHPSLLYDHVKCPNSEILVSLSTTISKDGPKVKYVCGKKQR